MAFFDYYVYDVSNITGETARILLANTTVAAHPAPAPVLASATPPTLGRLSASISGNRNVHGLHSRGLRLQRTTGTGVNRKKFTTFFPITSEAAFDAVSFGSNLTVDGVQWTVIDKVAEKLN